MKRRDFIAGLGGTAALASPLLLPRMSMAQPSSLKPFRLGFVHPVSPKGEPPNYVAFIDQLRELGYVEDDTLFVEYINLEGHPERYDEAMRELVRRRVDLIYALGQEENLRAAMAATSTIPIVMLAISYDPIAKGYVSSLARPTGNVTGVTVLGVELIKKRLQLFKDAFPERHAAFGFWDFEFDESWRIATDAAPSLGITLSGVKVGGTPYDYEGGFQQVPSEFRGALFMANAAVFVRDAERLAAFALHHRMISCFDSSPIYVEAGGLMSYGADLRAAARRAAVFADRLIRGAKPSELPVEQATRFTLRINLKTAKILGTTFSPTFLATADDVIE